MGVQDAGEPIAGDSVKLYTPVMNALIAATATNANGKYLFTNLTPGTYYVNLIHLPVDIYLVQLMQE